MSEAKTNKSAALYTVNLSSGQLFRAIMNEIGKQNNEAWSITGPDLADLEATNYKRLGDAFVEKIQKGDMHVHVIDGDIAGIDNQENVLFIRELLAETARLCPTIPVVLYSGIYKPGDLSLTEELPNIHAVNATEFDLPAEHEKVRALAKRLRSL